MVDSSNCRIYLKLTSIQQIRSIFMVVGKQKIVFLFSIILTANPLRVICMYSYVLSVLFFSSLIDNNE